MSTATLPVAITDPINAKILAVSEDKVQGFQPDPMGEIARLSGVDLPTVIERIQAMLRAASFGACGKRSWRRTWRWAHWSPGWCRRRS